MHNQNHPVKDKYCEWSKIRSKKLYPKFNNYEFFCNNEVSFNVLNGFEKYKNSHILVLAAGPSSIDFDISTVDYDYIWTVNSFFLNEEASKIDFDLISVGNRVNVKTPLFNEYIENHDCYVGFELTSTSQRIAELPYINDTMVKKYYDRLFWYQTKAYIGLGSGIELIDFASALRPSTISFVGIDGICGTNVPHKFENGKTEQPHNYSENLMYTRFKKWWAVYRQPHITYNNLGYGNEYNLLTRIQDESI